MACSAAFKMYRDLWRSSNAEIDIIAIILSRNLDCPCHYKNMASRKP